MVLAHVSKCFQGRFVLRDLSLTLEAGEGLCLLAPSGGGKTTLLRLMAGLETPDSGSVTGAGRVSMLFQEDRLLEDFTPLDDLRLVLGRRREAELRDLLVPLLPEDCLRRPSRTLSGGMRRRVALVRALAAPGETLLLDEPFAGLDEASREAAIGYIHARRRQRRLVVATHRAGDAAALGARVFSGPYG